jgi:KUP system potassium uptake protein
MEAAYGLAITITMLVDTVLFCYFMHMKKFNKIFIGLFLVTFLVIETAFLGANIVKFWHGGWVTILVAGGIFAIMWVWNHASALKKRYTEYVPFEDHLSALKDLSADPSIPKYSTHVVYMTGAPVVQLIESKIIYSLFHKTPKKADVYWFIHVAVSDDPYTMEYEVTPLIDQHAFRIDFNLGFRLEPRINILFREVLEDMIENKEVDILSRYDSLRKNNITGDFRFVVLEKSLSSENDLPAIEKFIMNFYQFLKHFSLSEEQSYGLDTSLVISEKVPLLIAPSRNYGLKRVYQC